MTNFEKWKEGLSVETAWLTIRHCGWCPAKSGTDCGYFQSHKCAENFNRWANAEAEEEK